MQMRTVPIRDLTPAHYNPRQDLKPGDPEYHALARSMATFGYVDPIIWNERTGRVVGGHQRLKVMLEAGVTDVEVSVVDLDDEGERALNLALNKISGQWDVPMLKDLIEALDTGQFDFDVTGFTQQDLHAMFLAVPPEGEDGGVDPGGSGHQGCPYWQDGKCSKP